MESEVPHRHVNEAESCHLQSAPSRAGCSAPGERMRRQADITLIPWLAHVSS